MLPDERRQRILEEIQLTGAVRVTSLARTLAVSEMTVRRDLDALASEGSLRKVHGGATAPSAEGRRSPTRGALPQTAEDDALARIAASLVFPGMSIAISGGPVAVALARHLLEVPNLTVLTNSLGVAELFQREATEGAAVIATGGSPAPSGTLVGPFAIRAIQSINTDLAFIGATGVDMQRGVTIDSVLEADACLALLRSTRRPVVIAPHDAVHSVRLAQVCALGDVDALITSGPLTKATEAELRSRCSTVLVARLGGDTVAGTP